MKIADDSPDALVLAAVRRHAMARAWLDAAVTLKRASQAHPEIAGHYEQAARVEIERAEPIVGPFIARRYVQIKHERNFA